MAAPYFNPDHPLTVQNGVLNPTFWRQFFHDLGQEAFALVDLETDVTGVLQIINGGTGATTANAAFENLSPMTTRGDLITFNATQPVRLPIGTATYVLTSDGTDASWQPAGSSVPTFYMSPVTTGGDPTTATLIFGPDGDVVMVPVNF